MDYSTPIPPEIRENLVAYLDGELDEDGTLDVERTLTESAEIRLEVEALSKTWDLLGELPSVESSKEFTERTLASIQTASVPELTKPQFGPQIRRNILWASLVVGLVGSAVFGYWMTNRGIPDQTDPLLKNLPVIQKLDVYEEVGNVEYLNELEQLGPLITQPPGESSPYDK